MERNERMRAIIRLIIVLATAVNSFLCAKGVSTLDNTRLTELLSYALTVAAFVWAWWKNNNMTDAFIEAQAVGEELKALSPEAAEELFDGEGEDPEGGEEDE